MSRKRFDDMNCGVAQALDQVGDWWTLLIVRDAFFGSTRFAQFEESLGIAKNILSDRLRKLVDHQVLSKERLDEPGNRFEYRLTEKGRDLWIVLTAMRLWSDKWVFGRDKAPLVVAEQDTGRALTALLAVGEDGKPVDPSKLEWRAGPGATSKS
ncbi:MAG: helix-turn-helix domain-containing protein [Myxococcota bacterium]|nr:helix-turn-helix domain-containing protein [Myxococcota bacterium]